MIDDRQVGCVSTVGEYTSPLIRDSHHRYRLAHTRNLIFQDVGSIGLPRFLFPTSIPFGLLPGGGRCAQF